MPSSTPSSQPGRVVLTVVAGTVGAVLAMLLGAACGTIADRRAAQATPSAPVRPGLAVITKVVDGDTVHVRLSGQRKDEKVRLIGINTPETHGPGGLRQCYGHEAAVRTAALLPVGTEVRLVRDAEARDRYGRLLAYVYRSSDDLFVNLVLAREGYAATLTMPPNVAHASEFAEAVADARSADRGLWGRCGSPDVALDSTG
jgi:micrococcal nuclease